MPHKMEWIGSFERLFLIWHHRLYLFLPTVVGKIRGTGRGYEDEKAAATVRMLLNEVMNLLWISCCEEAAVRNLL